MIWAFPGLIVKVTRPWFAGQHGTSLADRGQGKARPPASSLIV